MFLHRLAMSIVVGYPFCYSEVRGDVFMDKILGINSKLMHVMNRIADFLLLNGLFIITSIPIITIGASIAAYYSVMRKVAANEEGYIIPSYFQAFRSMFKRATIIWGIFLSVGILLGIDIYFYFMKKENVLFFIKYIFYIALLFYLFTVQYVFVVLEHSSETFRKTIIRSLRLSIKYLPYTLAISLINLSGFLLVLVFPYSLPYVILTFLFGGISIIVYMNSHIFNKIMSKEMNT